MTPDGEPASKTAIATTPPAADAGAEIALARPAAASFPSGLDPGADPDAVRDWFELETIVDLAAPALSFAEAEAAAADYRRAARAENTRRAYRAGVAAFTEWCAVHVQAALPASPETVAAFLAAEAGRGLAVNTLRLRHAALRYLHLLAGYPPPTASPTVSATFAGIRRAHRRPLRKKTALVLDPLRAAVRAIPDTLPGLRDRGLLLVGFAAALRPSELAALTIDHLTRHEDGIALLLPWHKNDQEAHGTTVWLPVGKTDLCPGQSPRSLARCRQHQRRAAVSPAVASAAAAPPQGCQTETDSRPLPDRYQPDRHRFDCADRQEMDRRGRAGCCRLCRP
jgi:integrase